MLCLCFCKPGIHTVKMALRQVAPADNAQFYNHWLDVNPMFVGLCMTNLDIAPLAGDFSHDLVCTMTYLAGVGKAMLLGRTVSPTDVYVYTMGELLAPMISEDLVLTQARAKAAIIRQVAALLTTTNLASYTSGTRAVYSDLAANNSPLLLANSEATDWPDTNISPSAEAAVRVLYYIASVCQPVIKKTGTTLIVHCYVSILKRGTVSINFLNKIADGVQADLNKPVTIVEDVLPLFYRTFGQWITADNIVQITNSWKALLPAHALRLSLTVMQAAGGGLTSYITIGRALRIYSDFPWGKIRLYFPNDWTNFVAAMNEVGNNVWYGFNKDLGPAKSTMYKNLAYVAKELHVRAGGETALNRYGGWPRRIAHVDAINLMIANYVLERDQEQTEVNINLSNATVAPTLADCAGVRFKDVFN